MPLPVPSLLVGLRRGQPRLQLRNLPGQGVRRRLGLGQSLLRGRQPLPGRVYLPLHLSPGGRQNLVYKVGNPNFSRILTVSAFSFVSPFTGVHRVGLSPCSQDGCGGWKGQSGRLFSGRAPLRRQGNRFLGLSAV